MLHTCYSPIRQGTCMTRTTVLDKARRSSRRNEEEGAPTALAGSWNLTSKERLRVCLTHSPYPKTQPDRWTRYQQASIATCWHVLPCRMSCAKGRMETRSVIRGRFAKKSPTKRILSFGNADEVNYGGGSSLFDEFCNPSRTVWAPSNLGKALVFAP